MGLDYYRKNLQAHNDIKIVFDDCYGGVIE